MNQNLSDHSSRSHARLSASSAHRWMNCPYSATVAEKYPPQDTAFTREGTVAHEVAEAIATGRVSPSFDNFSSNPEVSPEMVEHGVSYSKYIEALKTDESLALFEVRLAFDRWVPDGFGTGDCIVITGNHLDVIDFKYGKGVAVDANLNPQLMLYGLGAVNEFGFAYDIETVRLHIFQPRIGNISTFETTMEALFDWGDNIVKPAAEKAYSGVVEMHGGEHCRFCPHNGACPEMARYCGSITVMSSFRSPDTLQPEEIASILELEPVMTKWLKSVKEQSLNYILNGGVIPGYKVVEGRMGNRSWVDELKVAEFLRSSGYAEEDITTLKLRSPSEMDKSLGKKTVAELLGEYIVRPVGSPTLVKDTDKRESLNRLAQAQDDFK